MEKFWSTYHNDIIWASIVLATVILLWFLTNIFTRFVQRRIIKRLYNVKDRSVLLIRRILRALWIVLGLIALSYIFIDNDAYQEATKNFKLILYLGVVAVATIVAASTANEWFSRSIRQRKNAEIDFTSYKFLRYLVVVGVYFVGVILGLSAFPSMRGIAATALGGAGVFAVVLGVASQEALSNLVGGLFIVTFKPFKIGDIIKVTDTMVGSVMDITLRHTIIRNYENKMIVIPNAIINKEKLINYDLGERFCCQWIEMDISYGSDIDLAKHIMREECESHPLILDNRSELDIHNEKPKVVTRVISLEESSVRIRCWAWARNFEEAFSMKCDLYESIKKRFDIEGVEIPFPYRTLVFKEEQMEALSKKVAAQLNSSKTPK